MNSTDIESLSQQFMGNTLAVKPGEHVWIEYQGPDAAPLAEACRAKVTSLGGIPHMHDLGAQALSSVIGPMNDGELQKFAQAELAEMMQMRCYIRIRDDDDQRQICLTEEKKEKFHALREPMTNWRVRNTRWLVTQAPTEGFAKACGMELLTFNQFYKDVCLVDYQRMKQAVLPLQKMMAETHRVRIVSPEQETDISFSIKGIDAIPCTGEYNIPDGECFTAPVRDSINGTIKFGPSNYMGTKFGWIKLVFEDGKVVSSTSNNEVNTSKLNAILNMDEGARYVGEFAINFNPYVLAPTGSILFDEKISGGIHFALGAAYDEADNGNKSVIHWDMVHIQRPEYGGGDIYFDDRLIRRDGLFVVPELEGLNPKNLLAPELQSEPDAPRAAL